LDFENFGFFSQIKKPKQSKTFTSKNIAKTNEGISKEKLLSQNTPKK